MNADLPFGLAGTASAPPLLLLLSAPSGGGKTTLCENLLRAHPEVERAITCTTRAPRAGERDGVDYHFLAPGAFEQQVAAGAFLEHAVVHGHRYGTRAREVLDRLARGRDVLLNIDVQGAASVRRSAAADPVLQAALVTVFLTPPSLATIEARLRGRGTDSEEVIQRRLAGAKAELARWSEFNYLILSGTPEQDLEYMQAIRVAEKMRVQRRGGRNPAPEVEA